MFAGRRRLLGGLALCGALTAGCGGTDSAPPPATAVFGADDLFDVPITGLSSDDQTTFVNGDMLFDLALRDGDGLGPLYTRQSCGSCHSNGVRGPGLVQKMVVTEADGITPSADQSELPFGNTVHPFVTAGATTPIVAPTGDPSVKVTTRIGPTILGRGYLEAIDDSEIQRIASVEASRTDAIHGRINNVTYSAQPNSDTRFHTSAMGDPVIGRFGLKARLSAIDEFTADAFQNDMGITSPMRPTEIPNPDGLTDDLKPGIDVDLDSVNNRALYIRMTAIPRRADVDPRGPALFDQLACSGCHVPSLKTRADYPIAVLAGIDAPVYTDLLLHDMGDDLADGIVEGDAGPRDWRTAPLIGLRFDQAYMHDGRATSIDAAIRAHAGSGSEAADAVAGYLALSAADQTLLLQFVSTL